MTAVYRQKMGNTNIVSPPPLFWIFDDPWKMLTRMNAINFAPEEEIVA